MLKYKIKLEAKDAKIKTIIENVKQQNQIHSQDAEIRRHEDVKAWNLYKWDLRICIWKQLLLHSFYRPQQLY